MFDHISKHLEVHQKYCAAHHMSNNCCEASVASVAAVHNLNKIEVKKFEILPWLQRTIMLCSVAEPRFQQTIMLCAAKSLALSGPECTAQTTSTTTEKFYKRNIT